MKWIRRLLATLTLVGGFALAGCNDHSYLYHGYSITDSVQSWPGHSGDRFDGTHSYRTTDVWSGRWVDVLIFEGDDGHRHRGLMWADNEVVYFWSNL